MAQKFKFPMEFLRVSQGENDSFSHAGSLAMDFGGKDGGADRLYCPCDMVVKRCRRNANGELYLESTLPVEFADGTTDYARLLCIHDNAFNVVEGRVLKQGDYFYDEGGMGSGNPAAFATHVHIEAGKGKWKSCTQAPNSKGTYVIENQSHLYDLFILGDDVVKMKDPETGEVLDGGYPWKRVSDLKSDNSPKKIYGVDVSKHQDDTVISDISSGGKADFVILRGCVGTAREDEKLALFLPQVMDSVLKYSLYAASYAKNIKEAKEEADYICDILEKYGCRPELPVFFDWEYFSSEYIKRMYSIETTPQLVQDLTTEFCERVKARGYTPGVYFNKDYLDRFYTREYFEAHSDYYRWYARPGVNRPDYDCYIWQYEVAGGSEYGYGAEIDKNILLGEYIKAGIAVDCKECAKLKAEMEQMEKNYEAALTECDETLDCYERDIHQLEEQNIMLIEKLGKLTVENGTLKETITSLQEKIYEKNTEIENKAGIIAGLNVQLKFFVKEVEKLQEQLEDAREQQPKENILVRIIKILFGGE